MKQKKVAIFLIIIYMIADYSYITGILCSSLNPIEMGNIEPMIITIIINMLLTIAIGLLLLKVFVPNANIGLQQRNFKQGFSKYAISCFVILLVLIIAHYLGARPLNTKSTILEFAIECVLYIFLVGLTEEFIFRGLLLNGIEKLLKGKNIKLKAVIISSVIFGVGHSFGMVGELPYVIISKVIWATALGIYFGAIYIKERNLWLVAIFHFAINISAFPLYFSSEYNLSGIPVAIVAITCLFAGAYGIYLLKRDDTEKQLS